MKNIFTILLIIIFSSVIAQKNISTLFRVKNTNDTTYSKSVKDYCLLSIDTNVLNEIIEKRYEYLNLVIVINEYKKIELELSQNKILSPSFKVISSGNKGEKQEPYIPGVFYKGKIRGSEKSFVAVSFFKNDVVCVFSDSTGNYNLEKLKNIEHGVPGAYIFYNDKDLLVPNSFTCGVEDYANTTVKKNLKKNGSERSGNSVCVYFECDYLFYQAEGNNQTAVTNFVTSIFNITNILYSNENINTSVSQIYIWTSQDPYAYTGSQSSDLLTMFGNYRTTFSGDVAMLLTSRNQNLGGVAWLDGLCNNPYSMSSDILNSSNPAFPIYSWNGNTVTHELGHLFGSRHTHWCGWAGGPIDDCNTCWGNRFPNEDGPCANGPMPISGTVMSYCHGCTGVGINWSNGFGNQPGSAIRNFISNASCSLGCTVVPNSGDNCSNAIPINSNTSCSYTNSTVTGATSSGIAIPYCSGSQSGTALDRWFSFSAQSNTETITVDPSGNTNSNAYVDAVIALYSSCSSSALIECFDETNPTGGGVTTTHTFNNLIPTQTYYVRVFDWGNVQPQYGDFDICVTHPGGGGSVPSTPINLTLVAQSCSTAVGTWSPCTNSPTGYEVYLNNVYINTTTSTSYSFTGLSPTTSYFMTVVAFNNIGYGSGSSQSNTITTSQCGVTSCSGSPSSLQITPAQTSASISWNADPNASYYTVNYRLVGGSWSADDNTSAPWYNLVGLNCNTQYEFRVKTTCVQGNSSGYSSTIFYTTACLITCSGSPANLQITPAQTSASISWNADPNASYYTVNYRLAGGAWSADDYTSFTTYYLSGLNCNSQYEFRVKTTCVQGNSSGYSSNYFYTTTCGVVSCNGSPANLQITPAQTSASISWNADPDASYYTVNYKLVGGSWSADDNTSAPWYNLAGLNCNTQYDFQVKTTCVQGNSSGYSSNYFYTVDCCPAEPLLDYPADYSTVYGDTIIFQWGEVSGATGYDFEISRDAYFNTVECCISPNFYTIGNMVNLKLHTFSQDGTCYFWRIKSLSNSCNSNYSSKYRFYSDDCASSYAPTPILYYPLNGSNDCGNDDTVYYNWSETSCALNYQFQLSTSPNFYSNDILDDFTSTYFSIWNHAAYYTQLGNTFYWRVRGQNNYGWGNWSGYNYFVNSCLTGFQELDTNDISFLLFPNPNDGNFSLDFVNQLNVPYLIKLFDIQGRLITIKSGISSSGEVKEEFNIENLARGIYVIQLQQKDRFISRRLSKL